MRKILTQHSYPLRSLIFIGCLIISSWYFVSILNSPHILPFTELIRAHLLIYLIMLLIAKSLGVIYPPFPGIIWTLASVPIIGWELAYLVDISGSTLGAFISFSLGKKYGYRLIKFLLGENLVDEVLKIKLKQHNQIQSAILTRLAAGALSDILPWGASLIGFRLVPFMIGYIITHLITTLPVFYFLGISISFHSWILFGAATVVAWIIIWRFKGRYLE